MDKGIMCELSSIRDRAGVRDDDDDEDDGSNCSESDRVGGDSRMEGARDRDLEHGRGL
jgi:hypothetical protein